MLQAVWNILLELSPWLLLGAIVAGLMHLLIPTGGLKRLLRGRRGVFASVLVGIPLPLCSCSVIPVGIGLRKEGVSSGAALGFLISTPQTGVDSVLVSGSFLGWPFAVFKVCTALVTGMIGGVLTQLTDSGNDTEQVSESPKTDTHGTQSLTHRSRSAFLHSVELIRSIWRWLVVGILVSALISWLVPHDQLSGVAGTTGIVAMLLTLLISLPLYVCATASVPIAAALVDSGLPPGAAMVFLMAGPATNLATLGTVYRTFGTRTTCVYLGTMTGGSILAGLLFDSVLSVHTVSSSAGHDHANWFSIVCSILILVMIAWFAIEDLWRMVRYVPASGSLTYRITGMTCENCATGLEREIRNLAGVDGVTVRFSTEEARISGRPEPDDILQIVAQKGFTATVIPQEAEASGTR